MSGLLVLCIDLLTEFFPATSIAFEKAESSILLIPPRNLKYDKLTSGTLLFQSYVVVGLIQTFGCGLAYFLTFSYKYGVTPQQLFQNNNRYFPSVDNENFVTNDGRVYTPKQQLDILYEVHAAWFLMIVSSQAANIWVQRTSKTSIFTHGFFSNMYTNIGVLLAIGLGCFIVYTPGLNDIVQTRNPDSTFILISSLIVLILLWTVIEGRKLYTMNYPDSKLTPYLIF